MIANDDGAPGFTFDLVNAQGSALTVQPGAQLQLALNSPTSIVSFADPFWSTSHQWTLIDYIGVGASTGTFGSPTVSSDSLGMSLAAIRPQARFSSANIGGDIVLNYTPIPEPSAFGMLLASSAALLGFRRRVS